MAKLTTSQKAVIKTLDDLFVHAPFTNTWWMGFGYIGLRRVGSRFLVGDVWVEQRFRQRGEGRKMIRRILNLCDHHKVELFIFARPFDEGSENRMSMQELRDWYYRIGFRPHSKLYHLRRVGGE